VGGYSGLGIYSVLMIHRLFPHYFRNILFLSVGVIDSGNFKGAEELDRLKAETDQALRNYVELAQRLGFAAESYSTISTEAVEGAEALCLEVAQKYPRVIFFAGKLLFETPNLVQRLLHNETAVAIQQRLQWRGQSVVIIPIRISGPEAPSPALLKPALSEGAS
jgi:hypothetical protein